MFSMDSSFWLYNVYAEIRWVSPFLMKISISPRCNCVHIIGMHDEIFHFEIFKDFMKILKYFMKFLIFIIKWLKTFKNMIKVYDVSRKYIMLFMHNKLTTMVNVNQQILTFNWFTYFVAVNYCTQHSPSWNFYDISEIFHDHKVFRAKKFREILHH